MMELLFDPLFRLPFTTGLLLSVLLPLLGLYLRLRQEWLAALGFAHLAGAGGVLASVFMLPMLPAALALAGLGVFARGLFRGPGNDLYALMILCGWSVMLLGAGLGQHARLLGQALVDGQLYFTGLEHLVVALLLVVVAAVMLPRLSPSLLRAWLFPGHEEANDVPVQRLVGLFNLLLAAAVGLAATAMGVMAAFALIFLPAWVAFALAPGWRAALWLSAALGAGVYVLAFTAAMLLDQPFGPVLVGLMVLLSPLRMAAASRG
ncbi:MAG: metal ABC transporter permease [Aquisalimonadaceae bacterium]